MFSHLELVNLCIGLQKGFGTLATPLRDCGYELVSVGAGFKLDDGKLVTPDAFFNTATRGFSLLAECKSGAAFDGDQLRSYQRATAADVRDRAHCHVELDSHVVDTVVIANATHSPSLLTSADAQGIEVALLSCGAEGARLLGRQLSDGALDELLRSGVAWTAEDTPSRFFLPIDEQSTVRESADVVLAVLVGMLDDGYTRFKPEDVLMRLICNLNPVVVRSTGSGSGTRSMNGVIRRILQDVSKAEFSEWIQPSTDDYFVARRNVARIDRQARARELRSLRAAMRRALKRLTSDVRQLDLFDR